MSRFAMLSLTIVLNSSIFFIDKVVAQTDNHIDNGTSNKQRHILKFVLLPAVVRPADKLTVSVLTNPHTHCEIEAQGQGVNQVLALQPQEADKNGKVSWTFNLNKEYKADCLPLIVTSTVAGRQKKIITTVPVASCHIAALRATPLRLTEVTGKVKPGESFIVAVQTAPKTQLRIEVPGLVVPEASALADKSADGNGKASWTLKVNEDYKANRLPIIITGRFALGEKKLVRSTIVVQR